MIAPTPMLTPRSSANTRGAEISTPHPKTSSELGYLAYRIFAHADASARMIAGMDTNTSAAAAIAAQATTRVVVAGYCRLLTVTAPPEAGALQRACAQFRLPIKNLLDSSDIILSANLREDQ